MAGRDLPAWAESYIGIRFADLGRDRNGCDCWGLVRLIWAERFGLDVPAFSTVYDQADDGAVISALVDAERASGTWVEVDAGDERLGDLVEMVGIYTDDDGVRRRGNFHVGLVLAPGTLIHVEAGIDAALGRYHRDRGLGNRIRGFWRHRELAR